MDTADIFKNLQTVLRHIAAGFIAIGTSWLCGGPLTRSKIHDFVHESPATAAVAAILLGLLISAIHRNLPYPWVDRFVYWLAKRKREYPDIFVFHFRNFVRRHPETTQKAAAQRELDAWGSAIHFLYCSFWACCVALAYTYLGEQEHAEREFAVVLGTCLILVVSALIGDWRLAIRELAIDKLLPLPDLETSKDSQGPANSKGTAV